MTMISRLGVVGVALLTFSVGCSEMATPVAPTSLAPAAESTAALSSSGVSGAAAVSSTLAASYPVVTLQADLTASPSMVTVPKGSKVLMVNNSSRYVLVRSYNCTEFSTMGLQPGISRHTMAFSPAGKTCDYFVRDTNSQKIFVGQVAVQ